MAAKPRILCVDDEPVNLKLLEALLVPRGYDVISAADGKEALERIEGQKVDLVLLDVMMPGMDGFEVCRRIKEDERRRTLPVIMITALTAKEDRVRGIEAGAEDFISKPIDQVETLTRIRMLLKVKTLNDRLDAAYTQITDLTGFGEETAMSFDPLNFNFISRFDSIVNHIIRKTVDGTDGPQIVVVGFIDENNVWQWYKFECRGRAPRRTWLKQDVSYPRDLPGMNGAGGTNVAFYNEADRGSPALRAFMEKMAFLSIPVSNAVCFTGASFCIIALNYAREVSRFDAGVVSSIAMQSLFLKSLALQVKETENAFDYLIHSLARAAEANDEDTGKHIHRVGEYCAVLAEELGMDEKFVGIIRIQATLHDVGKIHIPPDILKKPGKLTPGEFEEQKQHTIYGATILGDHVRLTLAKSIALTHHERWDGSGYPRGLKEDRIPVESRITTIADQYDALRNARVYKPAFDHRTAYGILTEGDGRTLPRHFDPRVLAAFKKTAAQFETIYERLKG
jgi:response regulator RpfG family c-di-GMP phosphodiesterase